MEPDSSYQSRQKHPTSLLAKLVRFIVSLIALVAGGIGTFFKTRLVMGVGQFQWAFPTVIYNFHLFIVIFISIPFLLRKRFMIRLPGLKTIPLGIKDIDTNDDEYEEESERKWDGLGLVHSSPAYITQLTTTDLISLYGYPVECHDVETEDGYILTLHRIPFGKGQWSYSNEKRPVVFLQHGLFASSFEWFMNSPDKLLGKLHTKNTTREEAFEHNICWDVLGLVLQLADAGYDVWLGNARGNTYSRGHVRLLIIQREYWEFSVHEMGKYDLPASIDYVLLKTKSTKLSYIGFSMGSSMFWILMSLRPEYNSKVKVMVALAPVVYISNMNGFPKILLAPFENQLKVVVDTLFHGEMLPIWLIRIYNYVGACLCRNSFFGESFCGNISFLYAGWDLPQAQIAQLPLFYSHTPSPTSARTLAHIAQFINKGIFEEYDWGPQRNLQIYGNRSPPPYHLKRTKVPVALMWGLNDAVVEPKGVNKLASELPNVISNHPVNFTLWNHFDYHLARDVNELVNRPVRKILERYR